MSGVPIAPRRVFGVAFDASPRAGEFSWLCRATPGSSGVRVESVDPLTEVPGGVAEREAALRWLVTKVLEAPRSVWAVDVPLGRAAVAPDEAAEIHQPDPWRELWLDDFRGSPSALPPDTARRTETELVLEPAPPERWQLAAELLLRPLVGRPGVAVLPFEPLPVLPAGTPPAMAARAPSIYLIEGAPAATVAALARALNDEALQPELRGDPAGRMTLLRALVAAGWVRPMARALRTRIADADTASAVDATLLAVAAWRAAREADHDALCRHPAYGREGWVYC